MLRYGRWVVLGALALLALLGVNALASSGGSAPGARSVPAVPSVPAAGRLSPGSIAAKHRSAAIANAEQILAVIAMPSGSTRVPQAPSGATGPLGRPPFLELFYQAQVDLHQYWVSDAPESTVSSAISSHLPAGSKSGGSATQVGGSDANYAYELPSVDRHVLGIRQLVVHMFQPSSRETAVRIDAEVQYFAPWKPSQRIPAAARVLQITKGPGNSRSPRVVRTITTVATVRRIATLIEALPFEGNTGGATFSCPAVLATDVYDTFTFRATADGPVLAKLHIAADAGNYPDPCGDPTLTIRGRPDPPIAGGGALLTEVDRLLGVRLTERAGTAATPRLVR